MNEIQIFCESRGVPQTMEDAFVTYCKSDYAQKYLLKKDGDTIKLVLEKMSQDQVLDAWMKFLADIKPFMVE